MDVLSHGPGPSLRLGWARAALPSPPSGFKISSSSLSLPLLLSASARLRPSSSISASTAASSSSKVRSVAWRASSSLRLCSACRSALGLIMKERMSRPHSVMADFVTSG